MTSPSKIPQTTPPHQSPSNPSKPSKKKGLRFWMVIFVVPLLLLVGVIAGAYFYLTSDRGIRSVILPEVSKRLGVEINGAHVEWSPMRSLRIDHLQIGSASKPYLTAKTLVVHYDGDQILKGHYHINRIELLSPALSWNQAPDGSCVESKQMMDQIAKAQTTTPPRPAPAEPQKTKTKTYKIGVIQIKDMELTYSTPSVVTVLKNLNVDLNDIRPEGNVTLNGAMNFSQKSTQPSSSRVDIAGSLVAKLALQLDYEMIPKSAKGTLELNSLQGKIGKESIDGYAAQLKADLTTLANQQTVLKEFQAAVMQNGKELTRLSAMGPVDLKKKEADMDIQVGPIRSDVLNVVFGERTLDFLDSSLKYVGHLTFSKGGNLVVVEGRLEANPLNLASPEIPRGTWKPIHLIAEHAFDCDVTLQQSYLKKVDLDAQQEGKPLIKGVLNKPMLISWADQAQTSPKMDDAELNLKIFPTDITPYKSFLGLPSDWSISSGILDANAKVLAQNQGRTLNFDGLLNISQLACSSPQGRLTDALVTLEGSSSITNLRNVHFKSVSVKFSEKSKDVIKGSVEGAFDLTQKTGSGKLKLEASVPELLKLHPVAHLTISSGNLGGMVDWKLSEKEKFYVTSEISAKDLNLQYDKISYHNLSLVFSGTTEGNGAQIKISNAQLNTFHEGQAGGTFQANLIWDSQKQNLSGNYQLTHVQTSVLHPVFSAYLPEKQLQSIDLTSSGDVTWTHEALGLKAKADVKNLLVKAPNISSLNPLNAKLTTELRYKKDTTLSLDSLVLALDPTPTAKNLIRASGTWRTLPYPYLDLDIKGETIDATPYYDQLMPTGTSSTSPASGAAPSTTAGNSAASLTSASKNPEANRCETRLMIAVDSLKIRDFLLTEVKIPFRQKNNFIEMQNAQAKMGGVPILASITSEGTGEKPLFKFNASTEGLQIGPLCDVLMPETKGQIDGKISVNLYGSGKGLTKSDLEKSLEGAVELAIRDAHLQRLPSVQNGIKRLGSLLQSPDIAASTMDTIDGSGQMSNGKIHTENLRLKGSAIELTLRGDLTSDQKIKMEAVVKVPDAVLNRSSLLAQLVQPGMQPGQWVRLPSGINIGGTLSEPDPTMDKSKFIQGGVVNMIGNMLFPKKKEEKPADPQNPNQPGQQQPDQKLKVKDLLKKLF